MVMMSFQNGMSSTGGLLASIERFIFPRTVASSAASNRVLIRRFSIGRRDSCNDPADGQILNGSFAIRDRAASKYGGLISSIEESWYGDVVFAARTTVVIWPMGRPSMGPL